MPTFDFSLPKKVKAKRKTVNNTERYEIIERNVVGVVWIDIKANYFIHCNTDIYPVAYECYSCKGKARVYRRGYYDRNRVSYIRCNDNLTECNTLHYLPFGIGCIVKGNIVRNKYTNKLLFYIKDCWVDYSNEDAHNALEFYRNNINEIDDAIV